MKKNVVKITDYFYIGDVGIEKNTFKVPNHSVFFDTQTKNMYVIADKVPKKIITFGEDGIIIDGDLELDGNLEFKNDNEDKIKFNLLDDERKMEISVLDSDGNTKNKVVLNDDLLSITSGSEIGGNLKINSSDDDHIEISNNEIKILNSDGNYTLLKQGSDSKITKIETYDSDDNLLNYGYVTETKMTTKKSLLVNESDVDNNVLIADNSVTMYAKDYYSSIDQVDDSAEVKLRLYDSDDNLLNTISMTDTKITLNSDSSISGTLHTDSDIDTDGKLDVDGATTLDDTLDVSGSTKIDNTLEVTDDVTLKDILDVDGKTTLKDELDVKKSVVLEDTLEVDGTSILKDTLEVDGSVVFKDTLKVESTSEFKDDVTFDTKISVDEISAVNDLTKFDNDVEFTETITVDSTSTFKDDSTFEENVKIDNDLNVDGNATIGTDVDIKGKSTLEDSVTAKKDVVIESTLEVDDDALLKAKLEVDDEATLKSTLTVESTSEFKDDVKIDTKLTVDSSTTLNDTLSVSGATSLGSTMQVSDESTFKKKIYIATSADNQSHIDENQIKLWSKYSDSDNKRYSHIDMDDDGTYLSLSLKDKDDNIVGKELKMDDDGNLTYGGDEFWSGKDISLDNDISIHNEDKDTSILIQDDIKFKDGDDTYLIWNENNDGPDSGMNADKLDDLESTQFLRSDEDDSTSGMLTIAMDSDKQLDLLNNEVKLWSKRSDDDNKRYFWINQIDDGNGAELVIRDKDDNNISPKLKIAADDNDIFIDGASIFRDIKSDIAESGYQFFGGSGLIIQWDRVESNTDDDQDVDFPISFPNKCLNITLGMYEKDPDDNNNLGGDIGTPYWLISKDTDGFTVNRDDDVNDSPYFYYIAIGY